MTHLTAWFCAGLLNRTLVKHAGNVCESCYYLTTDCSPHLPAGQHLYCGLRRRLPRDHPGSSLCFHLHLFWHHPQRSAHIHPLQQVLRLLLETQVQSVHSLPEESREGEICQEDTEKGKPLLWKPPVSLTLISYVTFYKEMICLTVKVCKPTM